MPTIMDWKKGQYMQGTMTNHGTTKKSRKTKTQVKLNMLSTILFL
jgi:hypothetical protein